MLPPPIAALLGPLAVGLASGLNIYATVAALGLGGRFGWIAPLPPELRGIEHPLVIGTAILFMLVEAAAERVPFIDSVWCAIHAALKPIGAAILASALAPRTGAADAVLIPIAAALLAFGAHAGRGVVRASVDRHRRPRLELLLHAAQAAVAVALALTAHDRPRTALLLSVVVLLWTLILGPRSWRVLILTLRAQRARLKALLEPSSWRQEHQLPGDLRSLLPPREFAGAPLRAARAGLKGLRGVGDYHNGWLVFGDDDAAFLYRSLFGPRRVTLPRIREARIRPGPWLDALEIEGDHGRCTLFLLKDGPHPDLALAGLSTADAVGSHNGSP